MSNIYDPRFAHFPPPPLPPPSVTGPPVPFPPAPPQPESQGAERNLRSLALVLGVLCLIAAAVSLVAANWSSFDASMRAALLVGVTVGVLLVGRIVRSRGLSQTASACSWLATVLLMVVPFAVHQGAFSDTSGEGFGAVAGLTLVGVFLGLAALRFGPAMYVGATISWVVGWWSALVSWEVSAPEVWILPVASVISAWQWGVNRSRPETNSWNLYGLGLLVAAIVWTATVVLVPTPERIVAVIIAGIVLVSAGAMARHLAPIWSGGVLLGGLASAQILDVASDFPGWALFALVGAVLLGIGAYFERRVRRGSEDSGAAPQGSPPGGARSAFASPVAPEPSSSPFPPNPTSQASAPWVPTSQEPSPQPSSAWTVSPWASAPQMAPAPDRFAVDIEAEQWSFR